MLSRVIRRNKPVAATPPPNDPWKPHRQRHWRILYRGKDKKPHFHGQQPDESVTLVVRKHKWFLVRPALPLIGAIAVFLLVSAGAIRIPSLGILWGLLEGGAVILMIATGAWFAWRDLVVWYYDVNIITNKRLIIWRGFLNPSRKEMELEKIQLVALEQKTFTELFLGYGNLHLYIVGSEIVLKQVPRPKRVREAIEGLTDDIKANKKPDSPPPVPADPVMAEVLTKLGKPKDIPKPPDPDAKYPPLRDGRRIGPRRTFGGPFRIVCDVRYSWGESTVMYIQHSWFVLVQRMFIPVFALLIVLPLTVYAPYNNLLARSLNLWWFILGLLILGLLVYMIIVYINWVDDVYILTNRRIIDIERKLMFLYEARMDIEYKNIRDVRVTLPNLLLNILDIGDVEVETPGSSPNVVFKMVHHPLFIQDKINELKGLKDKVDKIKGENDRKKELQTWFGSVLTTLEKERPQETTSKGAPNLQGMDLFTAMEKAGEVGLEVVVLGEEPTHSQVGQVMYQSPPHGTLVEAGGELQVWLGRRPTPADVI
jgi:uncharacterized membrane protein YdbT with pleckstrin-like domain